MKNKNSKNANFRTLAYALICIYLLVAASCKKSNSNNSASQITNLQLVAQGLVSPVTLAESPDSTHRLFILDQTGKIWIVGADGQMLTQPFIDLSSKMVTLEPNYDERGLLGIAFHPSFKTNGKFYLFYTAPPPNNGTNSGWSSTTTISEFKVSASNPNMADVSSERVLISAPHPYLNHNGGTLAFGPDGYLYFSIGDGGNADDVGMGHVDDWYSVNAGGNAQNIYANLMGKVSRIDVNSGAPYNIPADNPFVGRAGARQEIYAYGFRNPYRFSFDMGGSHQLILGDAGQSLYEEINLVTSGGNYGWNVREGTACFNTDSDLLTRTSCPTTDTIGHPLVDPVIQLVNFANPIGGGLATVIVGGNVYRGTAVKSMQGKYVFGIYSQDGKANARIYSANPSGSSWAYNEIALKDLPNNLGQFLKGFGQDLSGEIYLMTTMQGGPQGTTGKVYKLVSQ